MPPDNDIAIAERIVRLETKLDFLISQMEKLPPSPTCVANHASHELRITGLEAWRNKIIGVMLAANIVFILLIEKIKAWVWP